MSFPPLTPSEFFLFLAVAGMLLLVMVFVPVQMVAKIRRIRRARTHITCRICGYRYLLGSPRDENICPHCDSRN